MIFNERQYQSAQAQIKQLSEALINFSPSGELWLDNAQKDALESQVSDIKAEIKEYELIKEGKISYSECSGLSELPRALICSRIASGMTQKNLADALGIPVQQIQRYEASNYMGASLARLIQIADTLNIKVKETWSGANAQPGNTMFSWNDISDIDWSAFPTKEMIRRGWFDPKGFNNAIDALKNYFNVAGGSNFSAALHRKKFYGSSKPNEYSLLAWQARVLQKARAQVETGQVREYKHSDKWIQDLRNLTRAVNAPLSVRNFLAAQGIALVFEPHLPGTYLDGAAMLLETGNPVVALTLRHDRLDNFWFVLFHELAHISLHLFNSLRMDFFDEEDGQSGDVLEIEADTFALETLISSADWDSCISRFKTTKESVILDAERLNIHPSIIAGRIRKERNNYTILSDLLGNGQVRQSLMVSI